MQKGKNIKTEKYVSSKLNHVLFFLQRLHFIYINIHVYSLLWKIELNCCEFVEIVSDMASQWLQNVDKDTKSTITHDEIK